MLHVGIDYDYGAPYPPLIVFVVRGMKIRITLQLCRYCTSGLLTAR